MPRFILYCPQAEVYGQVQKERAEFVGLISGLSKRGEGVEPPVVSVVSFAAPRVGDITYTTALGPRSIMSPLEVLEPIWSSNYRSDPLEGNGNGNGNGKGWSTVQGIVRDLVPQVCGMPGCV